MSAKPVSIRVGEWAASRIKALAGVAAYAVSEALTRGLLPAGWRGWASVAVGVAVYAGIYRAPANVEQPK